MTVRAVLAVVFAALVVTAVNCGPPVRQASSTSEVSRSSASPSPSPSPRNALSQPLAGSGTKAPSPASIPVLFSALPVGRYVTHLHSICNGSASFHITVLPTLIIGGGGTGSILVPRGYFGRGLCVVVYANASLSRVLTTQPI